MRFGPLGSTSCEKEKQKKGPPPFLCKLNPNNIINNHPFMHYKTDRKFQIYIYIFLKIILIHSKQLK